MWSETGFAGAIRVEGQSELAAPLLGARSVIV
jgi:hypothetical protein